MCVPPPLHPLSPVNNTLSQTLKILQKDKILGWFRTDQMWLLKWLPDIVWVLEEATGFKSWLYYISTVTTHKLFTYYKP